MMKNKFLKGIGLNVIFLGLTSFINDISSDMIFAIMPLFIASLGGAGIAVGLIGGLGDSISGILKVFSGYLSDKFGKKMPFVFGGYFISSIMKLLFPFVKAWPTLAFLMPLERVGKGLRTAPRDAVIANSTLPSSRGKAFGIHRALDTSGAFIGAFGAFVLFWFLKLELRTILFIAAIIGFFALPFLLFVKEKMATPQTLSLKISLKNLPLNFKRYLVAQTLFALGNFTYMFFVLKSKIVFDGIFSLRFAIALPILLYVWFNIIYAFSSIPAGIISDKIGRKKTIILGYCVYSLTCFGFIFSNSLGLFMILFAMYGLSFGLIEAVSRAFASDFVTGDLAGTALGTFHTCISLAVLPAGMIAGILWNFNPDFTFIYGAVLGILSTLFLARVNS
ncbi:MAG: MFS transporter [Candidatus Omnitrophota bacterium]|nr:MAG: MFS transporter [Candidatus Omnitrophota bacterium]HEC69719.1 MFS transporter [Candidatus Omnitrophota bacterium]